MSGFTGNLSPWAVTSVDKRVGDVAQVLSGSVVQRVYESIDGRTGVTVNAQKATTASEVTVANNVVGNLPALRAQFPGIDFNVLHLQSTYTEEQLRGVEHTLVEGIVLMAIVMLFFLQSWRNAIVVLVAIPTSLGVTLFAMKVFNLTLDTISLLAMTLVIGILIDDSTVVLENIERHREGEEEPADAALHGRSEIGLAATVITLVDVVVFLPIAFIGGPVGVQLAEFGIVVSIATLTSLFVSFTITPTLAGLWSLRSEWKPPRFITWFDDRFTALRKRYSEHWLPAAMERPWPIVIVAAILCVAALALVPTGLIGDEYLPAGDQDIIFVQVTYPPGHPLDATHDAMNRDEAKVRQVVAADDMPSEMTIAGGYSAPFGGFVQVIYPRAAQRSLDGVRTIPIRAQNGSIVRLGDVAHLRWAPTPLVLTRENRRDIVHVSANLGKGASLSTVTDAFMKRVKGAQSAAVRAHSARGPGPARPDAFRAPNARLVARRLDRVGLPDDRSALQQLPHAVRDAVLDPGRDDRRIRRALDHAPDAQPLLIDRDGAARRARDEERHPVRGR